MSCPTQCPIPEDLSNPDSDGQKWAIWKDFVQPLTFADELDIQSVQDVQQASVDNLDSLPCPAVHPPLKGVDGWTGVPTDERNVIVGPWRRIPG